MKKTLLAASIAAALTQQVALAEDGEMVVTATRTPTNINQLGSSVSVITADDIKRKRYISLQEALKDVPGLHVVQSGGRGAQTSVFLRGTNSNHVLVLIDGIEMNDPSSPNGAFDFANFLLEDIESIEVVRGSQSVLYGADAIGGVIQIRTKKGSGELKLRGNMALGSNSTHQESLALSGSKNSINYSISAGVFDTDGDSIAAKKRLAPGSNIEEDGYNNKVFSTKLGWQISPDFEANFMGRYIETEADIDGGFDFSGNTVEDPDATNDSKQLYLGAEFKGSFADGVWQPTLLISKSDIERKNRNERQNPFGTLQSTDFEGKRTKFGLQNDLFLVDNQIITVGLEHENEEMESEGFTDFGGFIITQLTEADRDTESVYIQDQIEFTDKLFTTIGVRYDSPDDFDSETTYRATTSYQLTNDTRFRGTASTGFKAPSLFDLFGYTPNNFGSAYRGNQNLKAETSKGWDLGIDQSFWNNRINTSFTYFKTKVDDLITVVYLPGFNSTSINQDHADMYGVESAINIKALSNLGVNISHTFTRTKDEDDKELLRRPKHKASIGFDYQPINKITFSTNLLYTGKRIDVDGFGSRVDMGGYSTVNLAVNYEVNQNVSLYARIDNLTDKYYEPVYGFQALERAGYVGIELTNY